MKGPLVSIILPTYNGKKIWLSQAIDSIIQQSYENRELLVINDASTNDVEETMLNYQKKDKRIKYFKNEENLKLTKTLNKGISFAKGEYIARIDDDDVWIDLQKLENQINFMQNNVNYGIIGTQAIIVYNNYQKIGKISSAITDKKIRNKILITNQFVHSSIMIRKSALEECGTYDNTRNYIEDYELWMRIGNKYKFKNLETFSVLYRVHSNSITQKKQHIQHKMILKLIAQNKNEYPNCFLAKLIRRGIIFKNSIFSFLK